MTFVVGSAQNLSDCDKEAYGGANAGDPGMFTEDSSILRAAQFCTGSHSPQTTLTITYMGDASFAYAGGTQNAVATLGGTESGRRYHIAQCVSPPPAPPSLPCSEPPPVETAFFIATRRGTPSSPGRRRWLRALP